MELIQGNDVLKEEFMKTETKFLNSNNELIMYKEVDCSIKFNKNTTECTCSIDELFSTTNMISKVIRVHRLKIK